MHYRIRLPGGTLKIKTRQYLRDAEIERQVPVRKLGSLYFIWWPASLRASSERPR